MIYTVYFFLGFMLRITVLGAPPGVFSPPMAPAPVSPFPAPAPPTATQPGVLTPLPTTSSAGVLGLAALPAAPSPAIANAGASGVNPQTPNATSAPLPMAPVATANTSTVSSVTISNSDKLDEKLSLYLEGVSFDENVFAQISSRTTKLDDIAAKSKATSDDLTAKYKKADADMATFAQDIDKKMSDFDDFYHELKSYISSQENIDDKEVLDRVRFLDNDLREFYQDCSSVDALRKDLGAAQKDVITQNNDKTAALFKIYSLQNSAAAIEAEFLAIKTKDKDQMNNDLKKLDDFNNDANTQLSCLQTIASTFSGKLDIVSGKMEQIKTAQKNLDPQKETLEKKLTDILKLKEKNATNKEAALLTQLSSTNKTKHTKKGGLPEILERGAIDDTYAIDNPSSYDITDTTVVSKKEVVSNLAHKAGSSILSYINRFFAKAWILAKKIFAAIRLEKSVAIGTSLIITSTASPLALNPPLTGTPIMPITASPQPPPIMSPLATPIQAAPFTINPPAQAVAPFSLQAPQSLIATPTSNTTVAVSNINENSATKPQEKEVDYGKDLIEAIAQIFGGFVKLLLLLWTYAKAVYHHFSK